MVRGLWSIGCPTGQAEQLRRRSVKLKASKLERLLKKRPKVPIEHRFDGIGVYIPSFGEVFSPQLPIT